MKLKQKRKYSYHDAKSSCHNNEATFPPRKKAVTAIVTIPHVKFYQDKGY